MSAVTGTPVHAIAAEDGARPWWKDREVLIPAFSGVALLAGLICEWSGADTAALVLFWAGLLLGASTFTPGALRKLFTKGTLSISLLMTISAIGAVILGYLEEAAALAFLYSIAEALEDKAMDRARSGLRALLDLVPETALIRRGAATVEVPARQLQVGDLLVVRPGERIATDGTIREGRSSVDASAVTGESIPVDVAPGDTASAHHQRSDVCAVPAAGVVAEAMTAIVLAEVVLEKFGGDSVTETRRNLQSYLAAIPATLRTTDASDPSLT